MPRRGRTFGQRFWILLVLQSLILLMWAGCRSEVEPPMRIGMNVWPGYEPLFLAREMGNLNADDFRLVEFSNASGVGRAFRNGTLEAACLTLDEVLYIVQEGIDPVVLLVLDESRGADVVLARPPIHRVAELKGKRVAVEVSAVGTYMLTRALQQSGLNVNDVSHTHLPLEKHVEAYASGAVDAVVTFEPARTKILALGAVDIFNSAQIPGEIVDVLVVRRDYLEKHPQKMIAVQRGWFAVLDEIRRAPRDSAESMAIREQVTTDEFQASLRGLHLPDESETRQLLGGSAPRLSAAAEHLATVMREAGLLRRDVAVAPLFRLPENARLSPK